MADSKEEKSWFSQAWDWTRNSLLGRTIGIDDATKAGKESKGLWGETKDLLGIGSSKETTAQKETVAQPETKGLWGWMKNSLLGRTFGLADEGNNEPGLWGMFKNSMLGRTFGLEDEGNNKPGLWGWMKNSMLGRALGLADKKEATANGAAQQTQAPQTAAVSNQQANVQQVQKASNTVIKDVPSQYRVVSQTKSNTPVHTVSKAPTQKAQAPKAPAPKEPGLEGSGSNTASNTASQVAAPQVPGVALEFNGSSIVMKEVPVSSATTLTGSRDSSEVSSLLGKVSAFRNGETLNISPTGTTEMGNQNSDYFTILSNGGTTR